MTPSTTPSRRPARRPRTPAFEPAPSQPRGRDGRKGDPENEDSSPAGAEPWIRTPSRGRGS